jgi:hypothetical protein
VKLALENKVGIRFPAVRPIMSWIAKHAADMINQFHVGPDGKTSNEIIKGEKYTRSLVEFGENIFFRRGKLSKNKLEARWGGGIFLGTEWRTRAAHVGAKEGVLEAHGIRRVPQEARWNADLVQAVKGFPWRRKNPVDGVPEMIRVRHLTEEEKVKGPDVKPEDEPRMTQVRLPKKLFEDHGYTSGCPGCKALLRNMLPRSHKSECRERMEKILSQTEEGKKRKDRHEEKMNEHIAKKIAQSIVESKMETQTEEQPSGSGDLGQKRARDQEDDGEDEVRAQEFQHDGTGTKRDREEGDQGDEERGSGRIAVDSQLSNVTGELARLEDMCDPIEPSLQKHYNEHRFYDENTGEELDPVLVAKACEDELQRFEKMKVYRLVLKTEAKQGKIAKVKWVRTNKGTKTAPEVRCRLVAMEFGFIEPREDLFAGAPPLFAMKLLLSLIAGKPRSKIIMLLDVKFLYGKTKRTVCVELPPEDPNHRCGKYYGLLEKAMCGARDAPQIWQEVVAEVMMRLGFKASLHHPSVYFHTERDIRVIAHVDDFLRAGDEVQMDWL